MHMTLLCQPQGYNISWGTRRIYRVVNVNVCIARAILKNAPVLILDGATSAMIMNRYFIQRAFDAAMRDRTTIVIAHRLSL